MTAVLDTNIIIRHLTQQPPDQGAAATRYLATAESLVLTDVIVAETVHVLHSVYRAPPATIARSLRALLAMRSVALENRSVVQRTVDLYEIDGMDFTNAYLVAIAESRGVGQIASFDQGIDKALRRASTVRRLDPLHTG